MAWTRPQPVGDRSKANLLTLERRKFPLVLIDRSVAGFDCDLVQADSVAGAKMLASHLLSVGHRRIAVIIEPDNVSTARDRLADAPPETVATESAGVGIDEDGPQRETYYFPRRAIDPETTSSLRAILEPPRHTR